jgi:hypothetical protein
MNKSTVCGPFDRRSAKRLLAHWCADAASPSGEHRSYREVEAVIDSRCACMEQGSDQFVDVLLGSAVAMLADMRERQRQSKVRNIAQCLTSAQTLIKKSKLVLLANEIYLRLCCVAAISPGGARR